MMIDEELKTKEGKRAAVRAGQESKEKMWLIIEMVGRSVGRSVLDSLANHF